MKPSHPIETTETALSQATAQWKYCTPLHLALVLAAVTFLLYLPSARFGFVNFDDGEYVFNNPHVSSGLKFDNIIWAFSVGSRCNWHPLTWISHMVDCQLFGLNPGPPHLINALLHSANGFLLFLALFRMTALPWRSLAVAAFFALHPLRVESVAWIAERKDVLSSFFWLLTLLAYQSYAQRRSLASYGLVLLFFALGLMSKPMLVTLPCVLLLLDYWPLERLRSVGDAWRLVWEKLPLFGLSAIASLINFQVQKSGGAVVPLYQLPMLPRLENAIHSYGRYLAKTFWPDRLATPVPFENIYEKQPAVIAAGIVLIALTIVAIRLGKRHKFIPVGWFFYVGTLVPVIGIVQVGSQGSADRYTYIPCMGISVLIVWTLAGAFRHWHVPRAFVAALTVVALSAYAAASFHQLGFWRNSETLFKNAMAVFPDNLDPQNCLAWSYATDPDPALRNGPEAVRLALHCVEVSRRTDWSYLETLAAAYAECGQFEMAIQTAEEVLAMPVPVPLSAEALSDMTMRLEGYRAGKSPSALYQQANKEGD